MPHLQPNVVRHFLVFNQPSYKAKISIASSGVRHFDLFETRLHEQLEEAAFLLNGHGIGEGLVPIAEVCGEPYGGCIDSFGGPCSVGKV